MQVYLRKFTHVDLITAMETAVFKETGILFSFSFELALDGNLDLYIEKPTDFSRPQVEKLVDLGWFDTSILDEVEGDTGLDPFWQDDTLGHSHNLFQFVLEKTVGEGANAVGAEDLGDVVLLTIAIPVSAKE